MMQALNKVDQSNHSLSLTRMFSFRPNCFLGPHYRPDRRIMLFDRSPDHPKKRFMEAESNSILLVRHIESNF